MNCFKIQDTSFNLTEGQLTENFVVSSIPRGYSVRFETCNIGETVSSLLGEKDILLIDRNVLQLIEPKYLNFDRSRMFVVDANEQSKNIEGALSVVDFMFSCGFTKGETLVVVGGGITQDLGAFAGSIYKRGINWKFVPTTLLSQCDSCIGGKTGINYKKAKNQLALFSAPSEVIINTNFLRTLEDREIKSGLGEIMKIFIIGGRRFVELYGGLVSDNKVRDFEDFKKLIVSALHVKRIIVEEDEFEQDIRRSLNYGHTIGHAVESLAEYKIPHGQAVAIGMKIVNDLSGFSDPGIDRCIDELIGPAERELLKNIDFSKISSALKRDKKTVGDNATFVFIEALGQIRFQKKKIDNELLARIQDSVVEIVNG